MRAPVPADDRRRIIRSMFHEGRRFRLFAWRFTTLMVLSVCLATLGLIADSPAVIIGAMVVAPLMGPVLGIAASIVMSWPDRLQRQALIVVIGALGAVAVAALISALVPGRPTSMPGELLARTEPNLLDLAIAMAAGTVGAYTLVRREAAEAMAGAAIAVALVPPLATVGIGLELGRTDMAIGATLLVLANIVGVILAGALTFLVIGLVPRRITTYDNRSLIAGVRWVALAAVLMVVPLQWDGPGVLAPPPERKNVQQVIELWSGDPAPIEVVELDVSLDRGMAAVDVVVAVPDRISDREVDELANELASHLGRPVELELQQVASLQSRVIGGNQPETTTPPADEEIVDDDGGSPDEEPKPAEKTDSDGDDRTEPAND